jgi:DNA-directed RNA polymerase subunit RPC12/RpoP
MDTPLPENSLLCTQCGGELHPDEGQIFLTCPYCSSTVYLDKERVVFHWYLAPTLDENKARSALARWMAGNETVKDLDKKSQVNGEAFEYFPVWYFKRRSEDGKEEILLEPAAATSVSELRKLKLPAGDLRKYDSSVDPTARPPSVPLETARGWTLERQPSSEKIAEQALVHIPLYTFKYTYQGKSYTAIVEAGTGGVFANIFPAKAEAPYLLAGGVTALVFLCLALIPVIGAATGRASGAGIGFLICAGVGIIAAPLLFALAAWVAAKI